MDTYDLERLNSAVDESINCGFEEALDTLAIRKTDYGMFEVYSDSRGRFIQYDNLHDAIEETMRNYTMEGEDPSDDIREACSILESACYED